MELKTIEITEKNILSFEPYISDEHIAMIRQRDTGAIGLLMENMRSCGALFYRKNEDEGSVFVESLYVEESVRRNGGGTLLLNTMYKKLGVIHSDEADEAYSDEPGGVRQEEHGEPYRDVVVRILPECVGTLKPFLEAVGYEDFVPGEWIFEIESIDIEEWMKSDVTKDAIQKAKDKKDRVSTIDQNDITAGKIPSDVEFDSDISYKTGDGGYILSTRAGDNDILIQEINLPEDNDDKNTALLYTACKSYAAIQKDIGATHFYTGAQELRDLISSFFPRAEVSQVLYAYTDIDKPEGRIRIDRSTFTIPRINTIAKMLDDADIPAWVDYDSKEGHAIYLDREDDKRRIFITCEMADDLGENFMTTISSAFLIDDLDAPEKKKLYEWKEKPGIAAVSIDEDTGMATCEVNIPEGMLPQDEETFIGMLKTFMKEVDTLSAVDGQTGVSLRTTLLDDEL